MSKNKFAIAISLVLMFAMTISIVSIPIATAQSDTRTTHAFIGATPNPVGVGQETLLHIGVMQQLNWVYQGWEGLTVTVEKPDGTTITLGPFRTDATGGTGYSYVPEMEGTYKLQTHFPAQVTTEDNGAPGSPTGTTMLASDSEVLELVVQADPIPIYSEHSLPTEYWTRPIDAQLRGWSPVAGSWLTTPDNAIANGNDNAPETAHILWNEPLVLGGLAGGDLGDAGTYTGDAYEGKFSGSLIIQGILFYVKFDSIGGNSVENWVVAVDLHTGEHLWEKALYAYGNTSQNRLNPSFGQIFYWDSFNAHGTQAYLYCTSGSTWHAFDPLTGRWLFTFENVPSGSNLYGPHGEIIRYQVNLNAGYMTMWNSTAVIAAYWGDDPTTFQWGSWRPQGKIMDASGPCRVTYATPLGFSGYQWNVSIPTGLSGSAAGYKIEDRVVGSQMIAETSYFGGTMGVSQIKTWGISLEPGSEGRLLFNEVWNAPASWATGNLSISGAADSIDDGIMTYWSKETRQTVAFSTETGKQIWGPTESQNYLDYLGHRTYVAYGRFFSQGMSGILYCYNATTGDLLWTYAADDPYNQVLWANQWHIRPIFFADGKIYMGTTEHSPVNPLTRGGPFVCVDCETGEEVFRADGLFRQNDWGGRAIIGDSIIATMDSYDQQVYAIGKGPSATTVEIENDVVSYGDIALVKGMVTDVSPGTKEYALTARFPNGVPAVADENMSEWMLYVYKQFERPTDVAGVEVVVEVLDPNGNFYEVGRTTSDASGKYSVDFTPAVPGKYTVIVTFAGSNGYYSSWGETDMMVKEAQTPTAAPTPTPAPMTDTIVTGFGIGMIIAIVAIGLLIILMLRKR
jgi:hypothetical protein